MGDAQTVTAQPMLIIAIRTTADWLHVALERSRSAISARRTSGRETEAAEGHAFKFSFIFTVEDLTACKSYKYTKKDKTLKHAPKTKSVPNVLVRDKSQSAITA